MIPDINPLYVKFGVHDQCSTILDKRMFFPCLLTGPSGIGKTETIEQICAVHKRDYYRVNITFQTDEDDLIGGLRLLDGNTLFEKGPVIAAMEAGGILLLDEVDLASPLLIMCLQSILEGKGYLIKKTKEWVSAKEGFQVFATANTKGTGDMSGAFVGTQILNEAFLERFPITFECTYPDKKIEKKILTTLSKYNNIENTNCLIDSLIDFANKVRKSYVAGNVPYTISTRRLVHILKAFSIWKDAEIAVEYCLNRFDEHTKNAFLDIFNLSYAEYKNKEISPIKENLNLSGWNSW